MRKPKQRKGERLSEYVMRLADWKQAQERAKPFRIIPRTAHYKPYGDTKPSLADTEALLFLPDLPARAGFVACYAREGEHSEAALEFYRDNTSPPDERAKELCAWYVKNKCAGKSAQVQKSFKRVAS